MLGEDALRRPVGAFVVERRVLLLRIIDVRRGRRRGRRPRIVLGPARRPAESARLEKDECESYGEEPARPGHWCEGYHDLAVSEAGLGATPSPWRGGGPPGTNTS